MESPSASDTSEASQPVDTDRPAAPPRRRIDPSELLSRLWQQNLPLMRERVTNLEQAAQEAVAGSLTASARTAASDLAHKLAGSLGMFGYPRGTEIAREIEHLLEAEGDPEPSRFAELCLQLRSVLPL